MGRSSQTPINTKMRVPRLFFADCKCLTGEVALTGHNHHYLANILRVRKKQALKLFDGYGYVIDGLVASISKNEITVILDHGNFFQDNRLPVVLGLSLIKSQNFDWALQKATELGVTAIQPLLTRFTASPPPNERLAKKEAHWQQILINACRQSENPWLPQLRELKSIDQLELKNHQTVVAHPETRTATLSSQSPTTLLIGPEGGFSEEEVDTFLKNEVKSMSLGPRILRAETAAIVGLSLLGRIYGQY